MAKSIDTRVESRNMITRGLLHQLHVISTKNGKGENLALPRTVEQLPSEVGGNEEYKCLFLMALGLVPKFKESQVTVDKRNKANVIAKTQKVEVSLPKSKRFRKERSKPKKVEVLSHALPSSSASSSNETEVVVEVVDLVSSDEEECWEEIEILVEPQLTSELADIHKFVCNRKPSKEHLPFLPDAIRNFKFTGATYNNCPWNKHKK